MQEYPIIPDSIASFVNEALAAFLHAHMHISVKNLTSSVQRGDGLELLKRLQTMYASATQADQSRALSQLNQLQMHDKEAIINFVSRFRNQVIVLSDTTQDPSDLLSDKQLSTLFIDKLCANNTIEGDIRHALLNCKNELYSDHNTKTLTEFENEMCVAEDQAYRSGNRTNLRSTKPTGDDIICGFCHKKGHTAPVCRSNPANRRQQANSAQTGRGHGRTPSTAGRGNGHRRPPTCFGCGLSHSLSVCPTSSPEERERIYREKLGPRPDGPNTGRG